MAKKVNKDEVLSEEFFAKMDEKFGEGTLSLSDRIMKLDSVSTGSIELDMALGVGGFPRGRVVEIYGQEMSAKTTLALHTIANAQKNNILCAFIDVEHALDVDYAKKLGVNFKKLLLSQPDCGDDALNLTEDLVETGKVGYIVIDSVAALVPKAEIERQIGKELPGLQARMMSQALRKLIPKCAKFNTAVIFINQMRDKIGVIFGEKKTTSGGNALKFYASLRLDVRKGDPIPFDTTKPQLGNKGTFMRVKAIKNKVAPPMKFGLMKIMYHQGFDLVYDLIDIGVEYGIINQSGSWYSYKDNKLGQGKDKVIAFLSDPAQKDFLKTIQDEVQLRHTEELTPKRKIID